MVARLSVSSDDLQKLLKVMRAENLVDGPVRVMLTDIGKMGEQRAAAASARASGAMAGGWEHKVSARSVSVSNKTKRTRGRNAPFNYPKRQEFGPGRNQGRVRRAVNSGPVQSAISKAAKEVEKRFMHG